MFFTLEKFNRRTEELEHRRYFGHVCIAPFVSMPGTLSKDETYQELPSKIEGSSFGLNDFFVGRDRYLWVEKHITLLPPKDGCEVVGLFNFGKTGNGFNSSFESLLYVNGTPYQGVDTYHNEVVFTGLGGKNVSLTFLLWTGLEGGGEEQCFYHQLKQADLAYLHKATDEFYYFAKAITQTLELLPDESTDKTNLIAILDRALSIINWDEDSFYNTVERALEVLLSELSKLEKKSDVTVYTVGHTHIDVAWLWRLKHTREKAQRSFSTVLHLMEQYNEYIFLQTQPQLYQYIKNDCPLLYEKIKEKIAEGKWEPDGGMWLEADCNLPSGESLVRQFMHGCQFIKEEFGKECEYLWLPDVFGYSWALPQILKQCNIKTFMTTKISWNQYNVIPNDTFYWRGIDGSEVLTYFIDTPVEQNDFSGRSTYNGYLTPYAVLGSWKNFKNKDLSKDVLIAFGYGDGGGGSNRDMLEMRRKMDQLPGLPNVKNCKAGDFFRLLHSNIEHTDRYIPTWDGELYLEYHRGTYTSQAYNKKCNRKLEFALTQAESLSVMKYLNNGVYDQKQLYSSWECVLLHQFHDIIPGSSIHEVYQDCHINYETVEKEIEQVIDSCKSALCQTSINQFALYSSCSFAKTEQVFLPINMEGNFYEKDTLLPAQKTEGGYYVETNMIPFQGKTISFISGEPAHKEEDNIFFVDLEKHELDTPFYHIRWTNSGKLDEIYDKEAKRMVLKEQQYGNVLEIYEDKPINFDAWDIDIYYQQKREEISLASPVRLIERGALRIVLRFVYKYHYSKICQDMILYRNSRRIDFETDVEWHEDHRLLKTAFYTNIRSTKATYDIQFGHVERPTHWNNSWDWAKFEVCAHKWADLSENGYGISILNDCKYGHSIKDNVIKLSLLKSAKNPDPHADMGEHHFTYSLFPHIGNYIDGKTIEEANHLNQSTIVWPDHKWLESRCLVKVDTNAVILDAVKKAEHEECFIIRLHECHGGHVDFTLSSNFPVKRMLVCNLLEEDTGTIYEGSEVQMTLKAFEIITLKLFL